MSIKIIFIFIVISMFILGYILGYYIYKNKTNKVIKGTIRPAIDDVDGSVYLFLEIHTSIDDILNEKKVIFDVSNESITQK